MATDWKNDDMFSPPSSSSEIALERFRHAHANSVEQKIIGVVVKGNPAVAFNFHSYKQLGKLLVEHVDSRSMENVQENLDSRN